LGLYRVTRTIQPHPLSITTPFPERQHPGNVGSVFLEPLSLLLQPHSLNFTKKMMCLLLLLSLQLLGDVKGQGGIIKPKFTI